MAKKYEPATSSKAAKPIEVERDGVKIEVKIVNATRRKVPDGEGDSE